MPNQRADGQKLLTVPCDEKFIDTVDRNLRGMGYSNRSQFVRDAIVEKMFALGVKVPKEISLAPDRAGKGGPAKFPNLLVRTHHLSGKSKSSSKPASAAGELLDAAEVLERRPDPSRKRKL